MTIDIETGASAVGAVAGASALPDGGGAFPAASVDRSVRPALPTDAETIGRIHAAVLAQLIGHIDAEADLPASAQLAEQWETTLRAPRPHGCHTLVAIHGTQVAGFASCSLGEEIADAPGRTEPIPGGTDIDNLWVDPAFARSGHASRLLAAMVDLNTPAAVRIWVAAGDDQRIRFLRSAGFAPAGLRRAFQVGPGSDQVLVEHLWWAAIS